MLLVLITLLTCCQYAAAQGIGYSHTRGGPIPLGYLPFEASVAEAAGWTKTSKTLDGLGVEYTHAAAVSNSTNTSAVPASSSPFLLYYTAGSLKAIRVTGPQVLDKAGNVTRIPGTVVSSIPGMMDYVIKFSNGSGVTVGDIVLPSAYPSAEALGWGRGACMPLMGGVHYFMTLNQTDNPAAKYALSPIYDRYGSTGQLSALQLTFGVDNTTRLEFDSGGRVIPGTVACAVSFCSVPDCVDNVPKFITALHIYLKPLKVSGVTGVVEGAQCRQQNDRNCNAKRGKAVMRSIMGAL